MEETDSISIPYGSNTSEALGHILGEFTTRTLFRKDNTRKRPLSKANDQVCFQDRNTWIYETDSNECPAEYIGRTGRQLKVVIAELEKIFRRGGFINDTTIALFNDHSLCHSRGTQYGQIRKTIEQSDSDSQPILNVSTLTL